jgi:hypothetical protein
MGASDTKPSKAKIGNSNSLGKIGLTASSAFKA